MTRDEAERLLTSYVSHAMAGNVAEARIEADVILAALTATPGDKVNHKAWAQNAVKFIDERGLSVAFVDWCGGWKYPEAEAPPAPAVSVAEAERYQWIDREEVNAYIKKQIAAERERCIKIINSMRIVRDGQSDGGVFLEMFKAETINAIRARAQGGAT